MKIMNLFFNIKNPENPAFIKTKLLIDKVYRIQHLFMSSE
jgi:hypothetical protein